MKTAFVALLVLHGMIHVLGAVKGLGLAPVPQLTLPIARAQGLAWGATAALFVASAALLVASRPALAWPALAVAVALSQWLIVGAWRDARAGTVANVIALVPLLVALADLRPSSLRAQYVRERAALAAPVEAPVVTDADLAPLPPLLQRYLRRVGVVGRPRVRTMEARFRVGIRSAPDAPWMEGTATQINTYPTLSRRFFMTAARAGVPFDALHRFTDHATMEVRLAGLVTMVNAQGPVMDTSETVTLFNDLCLLAPAALVEVPVAWETLDDRTLRGTFSHQGITVRAALTFNADGDLVDFVSHDRSRSLDGGGFARDDWSTPVTEWKGFHGNRLFVRGDGRWGEVARRWPYVRFETLDVVYNGGR